MSNHQAIVAKVTKTIEIPGADKIQVAIVLGETCIVGKDIQVGYAGVLFPEGLQLSEEYCRENNLHRHSQLNKDTSKAGFFDDNRRVRVQPFLKIKSTAYFSSIESLLYTSKNNDTIEWPVGKTFDELNGHKICQKYVSEATRDKINKVNKPKVAKKDFAPFFEKHVDSSQFKHEAHMIPEGSLIHFHAKIHGCFTHKQNILMWDGSKRAISKIVVGDKVVGYTEKGTPVESTVIGLPENGKSKEWVSLIFDRDKFKGNETGLIKSTPDHLLLADSLLWKAARDFNVGDRVVFCHGERIPNSIQKQIYLGKFVGDGSFSASGNLHFSHKKDHESYVDFTLTSLRDLAVQNKSYQVSGFGTSMVRGIFKANKTMADLFMPLQIKGKGKMLSEDILEDFSELSLAIWFMDDGSLSHSDSQEDRASFAVCRYDTNDMAIIGKIFNKFNLDVKIFIDSSGYYRVRLNTDSAYRMFALIKPYVPLCMQYKLPSEIRSGVEVPYWNTEDSVFGFYTTTQRIVEVRQHKHERGLLKYDLTTTTGNFVAGELVAHNSSHRNSYTKVSIELPKWKKWTNRLVPGMFQDWKWDYVVGTRNTVLTPNQNGFHGSEQFRYDVAKMLKPYMQKGMTIYGEIAGFANGKPIMSVHNSKPVKDKAFTKKYGENVIYKYGCKEHENRFHVYRITYLNHEGVNVDFTEAQIKQWCGDRGILHAIDVAPPEVYDGDVERLLSKVEALTERPGVMCEDYVDSSHPSEGVILRIDTGKANPYFLKSKSYPFKVMEGMLEVVDTEDAA